MKLKEIDTKEKILKVATKMFANNGFDGTSVRDIASKAQVNLAAINYHFKNKQALYQQVYQLNHLWMEKGIRKIGENTEIDSREFSWQVYCFFLDNGNELLNIFKLFLSNNLDLPIDEKDPESFGPPGQEFFIDKFKKDLGEEIPLEGLRWATRMIFSDLVHWGVSMNSPGLKDKMEKIPHFQPEEKKKSIYFLVEAILQYLKTHSKNWT